MQDLHVPSGRLFVTDLGDSTGSATGLAATEVTQYAGELRSQQPLATSRGVARLRHFAKGRNGMIRLRLGGHLCHLGAGSERVQVRVAGCGARCGFHRATASSVTKRAHRAALNIGGQAAVGVSADRGHPFCAAIGEMLPFPDRNPGFHLVYETRAGCERVGAVGGCCRACQRHIADLERADTVRDRKCHRRKLGRNRGCDLLDHAFSGRMRRILERQHAPTAIVISNDPCERDDSADGVRGDGPLALLDGDWRGIDPSESDSSESDASGSDSNWCPGVRHPDIRSPTRGSRLTHRAHRRRAGRARGR